MKTNAQTERIQHGQGFIAALDQSGGSTPGTLRDYGIEEHTYHSDEEMYDLIQEMRSRIITSPAFTSRHILGAILFEQTMDRKIDGLYTADYLWTQKGILPFLKVDKKMTEISRGVQLMRPVANLNALLERALEKGIFGTKMRSVIHEADPAGIHAVVEQQFAVGLRIAEKGLVPILEPEVNIYSPSKEEAEAILLDELSAHLRKLPSDIRLMFKVSIPSVPGLYSKLMEDPRVLRIVALSGGYSRRDANALLKLNPGLIASFSRALVAGLSVNQTAEEFDTVLGKTIQEIYDASIT